MSELKVVEVTETPVNLHILVEEHAAFNSINAVGLEALSVIHRVRPGRRENGTFVEGNFAPAAIPGWTKVSARGGCTNEPLEVMNIE